MTLHRAERWREQHIREELEAYAALDVSVTQGVHAGLDAREATRLLALRVCRTVADKSAFTRVTLLLRNPEGRFACLGSIGTDDQTAAALHAWGEALVEEERSGRGSASAMTTGARAGTKSFSIPLGEWTAFDPELGTWGLSGRKERRRWRRAIVAPIRVGSGRGMGRGTSRILGAIAVCADGPGLHGNRRRQGWTGAGASGGLARAMRPIETLAARLAVSLENEVLNERVLRTEKLAGLGQLAGGVAHALNNPLTAVLGFAELIAETAGEPRVRQDATTILGEARKMQETVQRLIEFWRPAVLAESAVNLGEVVEEMADICRETLKERGVNLEVTAAADIPLMRGSKDKLRQVMEHLLNNAAQAIATARPREPGEGEHAIRVTVSHDDALLHVIVSDTGPGFKEPSRIFDPFYTTKGAEQGAGMGLSICYGIVKEHGGEISAFNLHPHGAAVVVELPIGAVVKENTVLVRERQESEA